MMIQILFFAILNFDLAASTGIFMRCYCNLPECASDSFTCKSRTGCFQELPHNNLPQPPRRSNSPKSTLSPTPDVTDLRYGCFELWPVDSAPFQCTEPGIRKSPLSDGPAGRRRSSSSDSDSDDSDQYFTRTKTGARRRSSGNRHHQNKIDSRRWSASDVPLRCCTGDMCNRRRFAPLTGSKFVNVPVTTPIAVESISEPESPTISTPTSQEWWYTSMIFVPVVGAVTFFLLVAVGCWILHFGHANSCRNGKGEKLTLNGATVSIPAHYYFYETKKSAGGDSASEAAAGDFSNGRCVHVLPIFLSKYHGDCVVSVKPADTRPSV